MSIINYKIVDCSIIIHTDCDESLYLCKRCDPELWEYHDDYLELVKQGPQKSITITEICNKFKLYPYAVFDIADIKNNQYEPIENKDSNKKSYTGKITGDIGEITYLLYSNRSGGLSLQISFKRPDISTITYISDNIFGLKIDDQLYPGFTLIARRYSSDITWDCVYELNLKKINNLYLFELEINPSYCGKVAPIEKWDLAVKYKNYSYKCNFIYKDHFSVKINANYSALFKNSSESSVFYIRYTNNSKTIKIATIGSCFTREVFHSLDYMNPNYKKYYSVVLTGFHQSICSMMSKSAQYSKDKLDSKHKQLIALYADQELNKTYIDLFSERKPDYLIIDLFVEASASIIELSKDCYVTDAFYLSSTSQYKEYKKNTLITIDNPKKIELFRNYLEKFRQRIIQHINPSKIILVKGRHSIKYLKDQSIFEWEGYRWSLFSNKLWDKYDSVFGEVFPEAHIIDMRDPKYISNWDSPLLPSQNHLIREYYQDVFKEINNIVLFDLIQFKLKSE